MLVFLWRPIFTGRALLPGDYLAQMAPWKAAESQKSKVESPEPQWNPLQWDAIAQFYPWRVFYARSMRDGHIPLWNPHQFSGTPFLANGQSACLYPPNLIFLIVDPITAFTIFAALHLFLAQMFMYWLIRELGAKKLGGIVAAIVFAFSAFMVLWLELPTFVSVAVWLPLALMLVQRAVTRRSLFYGMLSGAAIGLAFLAGHFQIAFYVVLATGLWWLWKAVEFLRAEGKIYSFLKVGVPLIGCVVIAGLIAAAQVLPTQELAANSHRVREVTEEGYQSFIDNALPVYRLITAFAPGFFGDPSQNDYYLLGRIGESRHVGSAADYMEYGMYAGILPLMLALIALGSIRKKHVGFFVLLTVLALLTATGTPINRLFYFGIPGFSALGGPNRILLLYLFGVAALAGFGADYVTQDGGDRRERWKRSALAGGAALACLGIFFVVRFPSLALLQRINPEHGNDLLSYDIVSVYLVSAASVFCGFVLVCVAAFRELRWFWLPLVPVLIVLDLFTFGISYNPTCERSRVYPETKLTTELKRLTKNGGRIAPINPSWSLFQTPKEAILPPNAAMVYGLYDVQGYDSLYTRAYQSRMASVEGIDPSPPENGNMVLVRRYTPNLASTAEYAVTRDTLGGEPARFIERVGDIQIYKLVVPDRLRIIGRLSAGEPFSFRLGLFLMLVGVGALSCVGVYRAMRRRTVR